MSDEVRPTVLLTTGRIVFPNFESVSRAIALLGEDKVRAMNGGGDIYFDTPEGILRTWATEVNEP